MWAREENEKKKGDRRLVFPSGGEGFEHGSFPVFKGKDNQFLQFVDN